MTKEEYAIKLAEYKEDKTKVYYNALNKFTASVALSEEERRFVTHQSYTVDFDADGTIEYMQGVLTSVKEKKEEISSVFANKNVQDYYEITSRCDGYEDSEIDECYFSITWETIPLIAEVKLDQDFSALTNALKDALGVRYIYPNNEMKRMYLAGTITWEIFVDGHRR